MGEVDTRQERLTSLTEVVESGTILRTTVGSTVHGLHLGGQDDRDEMGVFVPPPQYVLGIDRAMIPGHNPQQGFEHLVERTQPEGHRSGPGDLDRSSYSVQKWMRLATSGNPTVLLVLFAPDDFVHVSTPLGIELRALTAEIVSRQAGPRFIGYLQKQTERMLGERGQMRVKRPELVDAHGFDTKYAMHAMRIGYQGIELLKTGRMTLPMPEPHMTYLRDVRMGKYSFEEGIEQIGLIKAQLVEAVDESPLQETPNYGVLNDWLADAHLRSWHSRQLL